MSAEEAAAKADALIAQYRSTTPQRKRAVPVRIGDLPSPKAWLGDRAKVFLVFACAFFAGSLWHAARPAWSALLAAVAMGSAVSLVRHRRPDAGSSNGEPTR